MKLVRVLGYVLVAAVGCARASGTLNPANCSAVAPSLSGATELNHLTGEFRIVLLATSGDSTDRHASGTLSLRRATRRDAPIVGAAELPVERVGAVRVGSLDATADSAPGVLVFADTTGSSGVLMRLGSRSNGMSGTSPIESEYTVLEVHRLDASGFAGSWRSGINDQRASGHFCARRNEGR